MQAGSDSPISGTKPSLHEIPPKEIETFPKEQYAVEESVPLSVALVTSANSPDARSGTGYDEISVAAHHGGAQVLAQSTRAPVPDASSGSLINHPTDQSNQAGKSPTTKASELDKIQAAWTKFDERVFVEER